MTTRKRLEQKEVETLVRLLLNVASRWAQVAGNPVADDHSAQKSDESILQQISEILVPYESERTLVTVKVGKKSIPTSNHHLQALAYKRMVAGIIRAVRRGELAQDVAAEQLKAMRSAPGASKLPDKIWTGLVEEAFKKEQGAPKPTEAAEKILNKLGLGSARRLSTTNKSEGPAMTELSYSAEKRERSLFFAMSVLGFDPDKSLLAVQVANFGTLPKSKRTFKRRTK